MLIVILVDIPKPYWYLSTRISGYESLVKHKSWVFHFLYVKKLGVYIVLGWYSFLCITEEKLGYDGLLLEVKVTISRKQNLSNIGAL